jgi:cytochrome c553
MSTDFTAFGKIFITNLSNITGSSVTTQAEVCWGCHEAQNPDISEWDGSTATFNYGQVTTDDLNWTTTTWTSANFSYKNGKLSDKPTGRADSLGSIASSVNRGSMHGVLNGASGVDAAGSIGCASCHDVHGTGNNKYSYLATAAPYLRGKWKSNPYKEDGAPQTGTSYTAQGNFGPVPRAGTSQTQEMGGYWIDQNSGYPTSGENIDDWAGLCELCHGSTPDGTWSSGEIDAINQVGNAQDDWVGNNGHSNAVLGGSGSNAFNVFSNTDRNPQGWNCDDLSDGYDNDASRPLMGYFNLGPEGYADNNSGRRWGFRSTDGGNNGGWNYNPTIGSRFAAATNAWGLSIIGAPVGDPACDTNPNPTQIQFHQFPCSKCHNPHASRLPRLMITNCLDTRNNSWDDSATFLNNRFVAADTNPNTGETLSSADDSFDQQVSNLTSAQNCHRRGDKDRGGTGSGWNLVTPWDLP